MVLACWLLVQRRHGREGLYEIVTYRSPVIADDLREVRSLKGDDDFLILLVSLYLNESALDIVLL